MEAVLEDLEQLHPSAKSRINARGRGRASLWTSLPAGLPLSMKKHDVTIPEIGLIAATRAMLGAGVALLLSDKLTPEQRRAVGWTLVAVGVLTTFPLALEVFGSDATSDE
jgi:hypothetical protein